MKMMRFNIKLGVILTVLGVALIFSTQTHGAGCQLLGVDLEKQSVSIGESLSYNIRGQSCNGQDVVLNIYGQGGSGSFNIRTVSLKFANDNFVGDSMSFSTSDFATKTGDIQVFFEAGLSSGAKVTSQALTVKQVSVGGCRLTSAQWHTNFSAQPILGSPLHMIINGAGCSGYGVSFKIYSADTFTYPIDSMDGQFDSTGTMLDVLWTANNRNDQRILSSRMGNYNFYFIASADSSKVTSNQLKVPVNSENGCINCNNVSGVPVPTANCADGSNVSGGLTQSNAINNACKDHLGDALSDKTGTNNAGDNTGSNIPSGNSQTYTFNITNPLNGGPNDLFDIINIVTQWIMYISVPLAVLWIMYAGFLMLTAGPKPENFNKGRDILKYTILGLAIIFIGKGFVSLIISVIELGGSGTPTTQTQNTNSGTNTNPTTQSGGNEPAGSLPSGTIVYGCTDQGYCVSSDDPNIYKNYRQLSTDPSCSNACNSGGPDGSVGSLCQKTANCQSGYECKNNMCQQTSGNFINDPCVKNNNCRNGATCNLVNFQVKDGIKLGTCE